MPRSAIAAGVVDFVLSPERIALELAHIAKHPFILHAPSASEPEREDDQRAGESDLPPNKTFPSQALHRGNAPAHSPPSAGDSRVSV